MIVLEAKSNLIPRRYNDLTGQKFGRLTCLRDVGRSKGHNAMWLCRCECGNETIVNAGNLTRPNRGTKSCGCILRETAPHTTHSLYYDEDGKRSRLNHIWDGMKQRCLNPNDAHFKDYGGRGISICHEWLNYSSFHEWAMANGYKGNLTIERKEINGNYEPSNCCWIPHSKQSRNRRSTHFITFNGVKKSLAEWGKIIGIDPSGLRRRLEKGWSIERTLTQPSIRNKGVVN